MLACVCVCVSFRFSFYFILCVYTYKTIISNYKKTMFNLSFLYVKFSFLCFFFLFCSCLLCQIEKRGKMNFINALWTKRKRQQHNTSWTSLISSLFLGVFSFSRFFLPFLLLLLFFCRAEKKRTHT